jgi:hypothetical protein
MSDVESMIREEFSGLDPLPAGAEGDWHDVLARGRRSRHRFGAAVAVALLFVLVPAAWAANRSFSNGGGISESGLWVCGPHQAAHLTGAIEEEVPATYRSGLHTSTPAAPQAFYKVDLDESTVCANPFPTPTYFIPATGEIRIVGKADSALWVKLSPDATAELRRAVRKITPYKAPTKLTSVSVNDNDAANPSSYLQLYTIGTPVRATPKVAHWLYISLLGASPSSPWTDGRNALWVSGRGDNYLKRDGQTVRIPASVAARIRRSAPIPK